MLVSNLFSRYLLLLSLLAGAVISAPQPQTITSSASLASATSTDASATSSSSYNVFSAIASDSPSNGSTNSDDLPSSPDAANAAGASGSDNSSLKLSSAAIIAIATVAGAMVLIGVSSAILFYLAKKRQWEVREKMRRSARKVAAALTPRRDTFARSELPFKAGREAGSKGGPPSRREKRGMVRIDPPPMSKLVAAQHKRQPSFPRNTRNGPSPTPSAVGVVPQWDDRHGPVESNMEKGFGTRTMIHAGSDSSSRSSNGGTPPKSTFDMDSPIDERRGWSKMFGRKK